MDDKIKQCKSLAQVARLLGEGSESAILHILMLRDLEAFQAECRGLRKAIQSINGAMHSLENHFTELEAEIHSLIKLC